MNDGASTTHIEDCRDPGCRHRASRRGGAWISAYFGGSIPEKIFPERLALIFAPEQTTLLQYRHNMIDEVAEAFVRKIADIETVRRPFGEPLYKRIRDLLRVAHQHAMRAAQRLPHQELANGQPLPAKHIDHRKRMSPRNRVDQGVVQDFLGYGLVRFQVFRRGIEAHRQLQQRITGRTLGGQNLSRFRLSTSEVEGKCRA